MRRWRGGRDCSRRSVCGGGEVAQGVRRGRGGGLNLTLNLTLTLPLPLPLTLTLTLIRVRRVQRGVADLQLQPIDLGVLDGLLRARLEQLRARLLLLLVLRLELLARLLKQLQ